MDLLELVTTELGGDRDKARAGLGALFTSIRMAVDVRTFGTIVTAMPQIGSWMQEAPIGGLGTGELLSLATPRTLKLKLAKIGFTDDQIGTLVAHTATALRDALPPNLADEVAKKMPVREG